MSKYKIGIDVGGTFTDFLLTREDGQSYTYKVLSTPDDPSIATIKGIAEMAHDRNVSTKDFLKNVTVIVHGTTVTTNAVLTSTGAKTALLTTKGVRDALEMRRGIREEQYNNRYCNVEPLVERYLRWPVEERLDYKGDVITSIKTKDVEDGAEFFLKDGVQAIAICFMNSFANSSHEEVAAKIIKDKIPQAYLTVSSSFLPSIRFYDRVSTTVLNSYVGPILKRYLDALLKKLAAEDYEGVLLIMQSNGGVISPQIAMNNAAVTLLSGPAGGPVAGVVYAGVQKYDDCITMDMGGTSFDAALIKNKTPFVTTVGEVSRLRLALPMLNVVTIGAGGGSIGWIDEGGLLRMGPQSAASKPGPVCYDLGGELPTCTDADLVLGYLDKDFFAGGRIKLNIDKAKKSIEEQLARKLKMSLEETALGMYNVINTNMAAAVREVSVKHGQDPRDFPLIVAGGAGPNHACMIALELEIPVMIVPRESSIFCAAGMLMSDLKHHFVRTYATSLNKIDIKKFHSIFDQMKKEGLSLLKIENVPEKKVEFVYSLDLRYVNQYHEVNVEITEEVPTSSGSRFGGKLKTADFESIKPKFHKKHNALFGYSLENEGSQIELINMRLVCIGKTEKPRFIEQEFAGKDATKSIKNRRKVFLPRPACAVLGTADREKKSRLHRDPAPARMIRSGGSAGFVEVNVYDGFKLRYGNRIKGPAIIEQVNTTTFVTPEFHVLVDKYGSYTLYLKKKEVEIRKRLEV